MSLQMDAETNNLALLQLQSLLEALGKSLSMFGMPAATPVQPAATYATQLERTERQYDTTAMAAFVAIQAYGACF